MLDRCLTYFYRKSFISNPREVVLFQLVFDKTTSQKEIDKLFENYDIEREPHEFNVYLSNLLSSRKDLNISTELRPRLTGVRRWHQFHNLTLLAQFIEYQDKLEKAGIVPVMIKGAAIRCYLPHVVRHMWDLDCYVLSKCYSQAAQIARDDGWKLLGEPKHSCDLEKGACHLDVHNGYCSNKFAHDTLKTAKEVNLSGKVIKVPSLERLIFILLVNAYKNLSEKYTYHSNMTWAFDLGFLLNEYKPLDLMRVVEIAVEEKCEYKIWVMLSLFSRVVPGYCFPEVNECIDAFDLVVLRKKYLGQICSSIAGREALDFRDAVKLNKTYSLKYFKVWLKYTILRLSQKRRVFDFISRRIGLIILNKNNIL